MAVVEARGAATHYGPRPGLGDSYDTVAIAGYDGFARARQTFAPRQVPVLPGGGVPWLPPPAVVAAGAVFYADGGGALFRLDVSGKVTPIADFATKAQQELWFAVSPDGRKLAATVLTVPAVGGDWTLEVETAVPGRLPTVVKREDLGTALPKPALVVGWDVGGALLSTETALTGAGGWQLHGTGLAHLQASGDAGPALGGQGCTPWSWSPDGSILCSGSPNTVRDPAGNVLWKIPAGAYSLLGQALSPDAFHVATDSVLIGADGWAEKLPPGFDVEAWSDPEHLVGQIDDPAGKGHADYVTVGNALRGHDLGFTGVIVGGVPAPAGVRIGLPSPVPTPSPGPSPSGSPGPAGLPSP